MFSPIGDGSIISAIKSYRFVTNMGLKDSKDAIQTVRSGGSLLLETTMELPDVIKEFSNSGITVHATIPEPTVSFRFVHGPTEFVMSDCPVSKLPEMAKGFGELVKLLNSKDLI